MANSNERTATAPDQGDDDGQAQTNGSTYKDPKADLLEKLVGSLKETAKFAVFGIVLVLAGSAYSIERSIKIATDQDFAPLSALRRQEVNLPIGLTVDHQFVTFALPTALAALTFAVSILLVRRQRLTAKTAELVGKALISEFGADIVLGIDPLFLPPSGKQAFQRLVVWPPLAAFTAAGLSPLFYLSTQATEAFTSSATGQPSAPFWQAIVIAILLWAALLPGMMLLRRSIRLVAHEAGFLDGSSPEDGQVGT